MGIGNKDRMKYFFLIIFSLLLLPLIAESKNSIREIEGIVIQVSDGDTLKLETKEGTKLKIRLYGVDAPETPKINKTGVVNKPGQPYSIDAQRTLEDMILSKRVKIEILAVDRYKRMVSIIWLGDKNINLEMLQAGMAEAYREYLQNPYLKAFIEAESHAKAKGVGIWSLAEYERPSEFRKRFRINGK